jgi:hypothetical protein
MTASQTGIDQVADNVLAMINGIAPTTAPQDGYYLYSADYEGEAGKASPFIRCEDGTILDLYKMNNRVQPKDFGVYMPDIEDPIDDPVSGFYHYSKNGVPTWRIPSGKVISLLDVETPSDKVQLAKDLNDTEEIPYIGLRDFDATIGNAFDFHVNEIDSIGVPSVKKPGVSQDYVTPDSYADFVAWANGTTDLDTGNSDFASGTLAVPGSGENWTLRTGVPTYDSSVISGQIIHLIVKSLAV